MEWDRIVDAIRKVIKELRNPDETDNVKISNKVIRDDIFGILERHCSVIYYPLDNEKNCGFHTRRFVNGKLKHFVYINTAQPLSKQVFAAAHELGHVWGVAERVRVLLNQEKSWSQEEEERIINRFAAELLMPSEEFVDAFMKHVYELNLDAPQIQFVDMVRLMVMQMNDFMVPCEAVRRRLVELDIISKESGDCLENHMDIVEELVTAYAKEQNTTLDTKTMKKTIPGLRNLIEETEQNNKVSPYVLAQIKADFDIMDLDETEGFIDINAKDN